ncbi:MAG: hypothetical protein JWQ79_484 [Mucilaginibacter sp.]|nr:hypothetical protein [Mucilaginibacter sp.]
MLFRLFHLLHTHVKQDNYVQNDNAVNPSVTIRSRITLSINKCLAYEMDAFQKKHRRTKA